MGNRSSKLDMAHALAAHDRSRYLNATLLANNILVANASVFTTVAFEIFFRSENLFVEETAAL